MTTANLDIRIKTFVEGLQALQGLGDKLNQTSQQAQGVGTAGGTAASGMAQMNAGADAANEGINKLIGYLKAATLAFIAYAGVQSLQKTADYAAQTETYGVTLEIVGKNAGYSKEELQAYEEQLKKTGITTQAARTSMTAMIQAGLPLGASLDSTGKAASGATSNISKLARAAQDLAVVTGENSSDTFSKLITNIQQMDSQGLRFMGITTDVVAAQEKWATANNTTVASMTQMQKVLAVNNEVLDQAAKMTGAYEASMETAGKKSQSLTRYQDELRKTLGDELLPAYGKLIDAATYFTKTLDQIAVATFKSKDASQQLSEDVSGLVNRLTDFVLGIARFISENIALFSSISSNILGMISDLASLALELGKAGEAGNVFEAVLWSAALAAAGLRDGVNFIRAGVLEFAGVVITTSAMIVRGWGEILALIPGLRDIGDNLVSMSLSMKATGDSAYNSGAAIAKSFADGQTATQRFLNGIKEVDVSLSNFGKANTVKGVADEIKRLADGQEAGVLSGQQLADAQKLVTKDLVDLSKSGKISTDTIKDLSNAAKAAGVVLPDAFGTVAGSLKQARDFAAETQKALAKIGQGTTFSAIESEIITLVAAQRDLQVTSVGAAQKADILEKSITKFGEANPKAAAQVAKLTQQLSSVSKNISEEFNKAIADMGTSVSELETGVSANSAKMAGSLVKLGANATTTSVIFQSAFAKGLESAKTIQDVEALSAGFVELRNQGIALQKIGQIDLGAQKIAAAATAAELATLKFEQLFEASKKAADSDVGIERLKVAVSKFAADSGKDIAWVTSKMAELDTAKKDLDTRLSNPQATVAFEKLGITAEDAMGKASKGIVSAIEGLDTLRKDSKISGDAYYKAFEKGLDIAKSFADITKLSTELKTAATDGKISWAEYRDAVKEVNLKFDELFDKRLKVAQTSEDFRKLGVDAKKAFDEGAISSTQLATALASIRDKAKGADEAMGRIASQNTAIAEESVKLAKAQGAAIKAVADVQSAKNDLVSAEAAYSKSGTVEDLAKLKVAKDNLAIAEAKAKVAQAMLAQEIAQNEVLIAQQQLLNAEKAVERNAGDASYVAAAKAAKDNLAAKQQSLEVAKQEVAAQEKNLATVEATVVATKNLVGWEKEVAEWNAAVSKSSAEFKKNLEEWDTILQNVAQINFQGARDSLEGLGLSMTEANRRAGELMGGMQVIAAFGYDGVNAYAKVTEGIAAAKRELAKASEEAQNITDGFREAVDAASDVDQAGRKNLQSLKLWNQGAYLIANAYRTIQKEAAAAGKAAVDAAEGFQNSINGIKLQLLRAQGRDDEAAQIEYQNRKKALALEYEMLKIKLQIAKATLQAAGLSTSDIDRAISDAATSYREGQQALDDIQKIEDQKRKEAKAKEAEDAKETPISKSEPNNPTNPTPPPYGSLDVDPGFEKWMKAINEEVTTSAPSTYKAGDKAPSTAKAQDTEPSKGTYTLILQSPSSNVTATVEDDQYSNLINLLNAAKKVS